MPGTIIISLDCEGRFGVADHLTPALAASLNDQGLKAAYEALIRILDTHDLPATFAVVALFARANDATKRELIADLAETQPYLREAAAQIAAGEEGWDGHQLLAGLRDHHELAFHGGTHTPWDTLTEAEARAELELADPAGRQTMVYPRNRVAHTDLLAEYGVLGYRAAPLQVPRWQSLLGEFNVMAPAERHPDPDPGNGSLAIPAGYFLNWRAGLRRLVPPSVTRLRAEHIIDVAVRSDAVAHFWLHPENLATAPATMANVAALTEVIALARDQQDVAVLTQLDYVRSRSIPGLGDDQAAG